VRWSTDSEERLSLPYHSRMAGPYRDPIALATTPHVDPATGETVWVLDGVNSFGDREPAQIVVRLGLEYRARAVVSDSGQIVWILETRRAEDPSDRTK
jgi:hypothetical protein